MDAFAAFLQASSTSCVPEVSSVGLVWEGRDKKKGPVKKVAQSFPVDDGDQVMLVTDGGQLIRTPVDQIRIAGRSTGGVWVLRTAEGERVVSVARLVEDAENVIEEGGGAE